jgi:hypothetical protein
LAAVAAVLFLAAFATDASPSERVARPALKTHRPFHPGEKLTYNISWSKVLTAGTAVMEVRKEKDTADRTVFRFVSTARTTGMVDKAYTVRDTVQSVVDGETLESISYDLDQRHGSRKKKRRLTFDHVNRKVSAVADGVESTADIPEHAQDALSSLYYVRATPAFVVGKPVMVGIHDSGKNWAVEVHVLGRERISTPVGEFDTVKVKTYPKYEGVFMHKGEIFMWLTDDQRRIPVLMKSTITIGSIVAQLTEMQLGDEGQ